MHPIRQPAVAGQFYSSNPKALEKEIAFLAGSNEFEKKPAIACMVPHAGYIYSGSVACAVIARLKIPETIIILGPNHTGHGAPFSLISEGAWAMPLGNVNINTSLAGALLKNSGLLKNDPTAHQSEHSIEVELPIIQHFKKNFSLVPIIIGNADFKDYFSLGKQIAAALINNKIEKKTLIIASSDMSHYEEAKTAKEKDTQAINAIIELNEETLWLNIKKYNITMCGYAPAIVMLSAAKVLGAKKAQLIKYQTSADVTGDNSSVVGYAGIIIT